MCSLFLAILHYFSRCYNDILKIFLNMFVGQSVNALKINMGIIQLLQIIVDLLGFVQSMDSIFAVWYLVSRHIDSVCNLNPDRLSRPKRM